MKPRDFINFFKTKSGKLLVFALVFGGGLALFGVLRERSRSPDEMEVRVGSLTHPTDSPQVVQTIMRPSEPYRPPPPKPEPPPVPRGPTNDLARAVSPEPLTPPDPPPAELPPISLFADATAGVVEPKPLGDIYAPFGRLISCETVITVDSASVRTPIVGLIIEDVYHAGRLVIPAGTEVHGTAQTDRQRERIASGTSWTLVWQTGEELRLNALALDREFSGDQEGWGITDGSAGLRGRLIKSDNLAEIKLFAAALLEGAASALTEKEQTVFGSLDSRSLNNAPFKGAEKVLAVYAQRIYETIQRDGFYVRVPSGKQFYLYVLQTIDRDAATLGGAATPFAEPDPARPAAGTLPPDFGVSATPQAAPITTPSPPAFEP
jgi:hypothetical protein